MEGEDRASRRAWAALRAAVWACLTSGWIECFLLEGGFESCMVLNEDSAARLRANLVQLRRILVRLGDDRLIRECWRRGSAADKRFSY